jgi:pimeloyl-ACP methyl ester carboxylesterase
VQSHLIDYPEDVTNAQALGYAELFAAAVAAARGKGVSVADATPPVSEYRAVDGLKLHLLDWQAQNCPEMLLLHGALLQAHVWDFFSLGMRQRFRIRAVDLRGHGDSDWAADADYSRARVVADIAALIQQMDLSSLVLVGHSFGGAVAAMLAAHLAERIRALVMVDSTLIASGRPGVRARAASLPRSFANLEEFAQHAAALGRRRDPARLATSLRWNARQLADGYWTWKYDPALRYATLGPTDFADVWSALRAFTGPVLYVRAGEHSHLADEAAQRLRELPNIRLVVVPDAAHNVMSDNPLGFSRVVGDFLGEVDAMQIAGQTRLR